ncbi:NDP-hexose 2,3-dehydratase family protein [Phaeodactylibacter xiamenensis]|uniref:NDP-hexose 2,3-dehydratase family protein n=1 Tax=Phaeodactylibacter xiamenensis TaxID=1524460 RepID=UPI003BABACF2
MEISNNLIFLKSALTFENPFISIEETVKWLTLQKEKINLSTEKIAFEDLELWHFDQEKHNLRHQSGKFFTIEGINVTTNWGGVPSWDQPIINQPEIGFLGFITKEFNGVLYFLIQAKIEPGNINYVQLSPTLQATKSNYTRVHKGRTPDYLEYFLNITPKQKLLDQLQSEQGARFLRKRNRNIIIKVDEEIEVKDNYIWLTLAQIKALMNYDNLVNMDTRTVISGIQYGEINEGIVDLLTFLGDTQLKTFQSSLLKSFLNANIAKHSIDEIINFITLQKSHYELEVVNKPLQNLDNWVIEKDQIRHVDNKYFKVIPVKVSIGNREVINWTQPMIEPAQEGLCAFIGKMIGGVLHFIVQAKLECGNFDTIELAPTVQCLTGNYRQTKEEALPFLHYVLNAPEEKVVFDTLQSEEGGRFYKEQNRNMIVIAGDEMNEALPSNYIWMTLNQLQTFLKFNNFLNIQARSLLAAIQFA